ncbi:hypothetical protein HDU97_008439 [Phlyctochytrium planicorne]|nr:hypothetical protein HDU97_008439 [Phlyctochytrium planicorne]
MGHIRNWQQEGSAVAGADTTVVDKKVHVAESAEDMQGGYQIMVGAPLVYFEDGHFILNGKSKVVSTVSVGNPIQLEAPIASDSTNTVATAAKSFPTGAVVGSVFGVIALAVAGLLYHRRSKKAYGRGGKKATSFMPNGLPVWEMGQWRVIRAEDWAAMNGKAEEGGDDDSENDEKDDVKEEKEQVDSVKVEDSITKSKLACTIDNMKAFLPSARHRRIFGNPASTAIPESEEDIESSHNPAFSRPLAESEDDEPAVTTIPFNYSLLSQLVTGGSENSSEEEEESKEKSIVADLASIHMGDNSGASPEHFDYPVLPAAKTA